MSYVKIWLHCVWGTKFKIHYLTSSVRKDVIDHIKSNATEKGIYIDCIDGSIDHLHSLILLDADRCLSWVMQTIKGESSYWVNRQKLTRLKFSWAVDYYAVSISASDVKRVRSYIKNQEYHHGTKTWENEIEALISEEGLVRFKG